MFEKIFRKEWKDKLDLLIFALAGILIYVLAFLLLPGRRDLVDILTGAVTVIFLPFVGLLLGAGGFAAEFKDDAWAYLFSRPVKRSTVWLAKYAALLTILAAVLLLFAVVVRVVPGLSRTVADLGAKDLSGGFSLMSLGFLLSWALLTVGFSLSFLTERQYAVVFSSLLIWALLEFGAFLLWLPFLAPLAGSPVSAAALAPFTILLPIGLALASLLAFARTDFSQPARKVRDFAKFGLPLLLAALVLGAVWSAAAAAAGGRGRAIYDLQVYDSSAYFAGRGKVFRFDAADGRLRTIAKARVPLGFEIGGGKMVFINYAFETRRSVSADLWMMNTDGSGAAPLNVTSRKDSPFFGRHPVSFQISPDGRSVVFAARGTGKRPARWLLGSIKADGSGLRSFPLDVDEGYWIRFVGWTAGGRDALVFAVPSGRSAAEGAATRLFRFDPETGACRLLAEDIQYPSGDRRGVQRSFAFVSRCEDDRSTVLGLMDVESGDKREVVRDSSIDWYRWSDDGSRLAFFAGKRTLGIYSPAEGRVTVRRELEDFDPGRLGPSLIWVRGGAGLAIKQVRDGAGHLVLLDADLSETGALPLPFDVDEAGWLVGIGAYVLVLNWEEDQLWLADLDAGTWRKIY